MGNSFPGLLANTERWVKHLRHIYVSRTAISAINSCVPQAKFFVCVRNPIDMVASAHMQLVRSGREPDRRLEQAWRKQAARRLTGHDLPKYEDPEAFQYGEVCSVGAQVERLLSTVDRSRVHFVFLEEMQADPKSTYRSALEFLGVADDGRTQFPRENVREEPRVLGVARFAGNVSVLKHKWGIHKATGFGSVIQRLNRRSRSIPALAPEFRKELCDFFSSDVNKLGRLLDRDLSYWLE